MSQITVSKEAYAVFMRQRREAERLKHQLELEQAKNTALMEIIAALRDGLAAVQTRDQLAAVINRAETQQLAGKLT